MNVTARGSRWLRVRRWSALGGAAVLMAVAAGVSSGQGAAASASSQPDCPWLNQRLPVSQRVSMLLPKMTLSDKAQLLGLQTALGYENTSTSTDGVPALCIPTLTLSDAPSGVITAPSASHTQLPAEIAMAATWDPSVARQYGSVIGSEAAAKSIDFMQAPELDIDRVPQWGRTFETMGEDPYLTGQLGVADIAGIHSQGVGVDLKHFAVYNQETNRNTTSDESIVDSRTMHEIYLPAFEQAVTKGHADSVMCSYADINGQFACQDPDLLSTLDNRWGFPGFVRTDADAAHDTLAALQAGTQIFKTQEPDQIEQYAENGQITPAQLDAAVTRVLREMFATGAFNRPSPTAATATADATTPAHDAFTETTAAQATVLLKNTAGVLPLSTQADPTIAVIGADGGAGAITQGAGTGGVAAGSVVTPQQGITAAAGADATVTYNDGSDLTAAAAAASSANVAVVFAGRTESEGTDLSSLSLGGGQDQLIEAVAAANPHTVVVLNTGDPVTMPWLGQVSAVLEGWYAGQEDGNAIARVLFGKTDPGGKLPETFPQSDTQTPVGTPAQWPGVGGKVDFSEGLDVGYRGYDADTITPLFPFGFGLSYTTFSFSGLHISRSAVTSPAATPAPSACGCNGQGSKLVTVSATVTNTGTRTGSEVAQLYLGDPAAAGEPPRQLKGFRKVTLRPGQSTRVQFTLTAHDLSYWDDDANGWVVPDGTFSVHVGDSSAAADLPLAGSFTLTRSLGAVTAATSGLPSQLVPGTPAEVTTTFANNGDYTLTAAQARLQAPSGWRVRPVSSPAVRTLAPGQTASVTWQVSAPATAQGGTANLTARLDFHPAGTTAGTRTAATVTPVSIATDPPVRAGNPAAAFTTAGQPATLTLPLASTTGHSITVAYQVDLPASGVTVTPDHGTVTVPPGGTSVTFTVTSEGASQVVPVDMTATSGHATYDLAPVTLTAVIPVGPLPAAFNDVGITSDADRAPGDIGDGVNGDSLSADALAAAGITPGSAVTDRGVTFTWPDVPAGTPDNVGPQGQSMTVTLSGSGSTLGFLGLGTNGTQSGPVTILYTDGTAQQAILSFPDWFTSTPPTGGDLITTMPYLNSSVFGQRPNPVSLFAAYVPLDPSRTVAAVELPPGKAGVGNPHIFAIAIGS